jgi:hypothetical protein
MLLCVLGCFVAISAVIKVRFDPKDVVMHTNMA